MCVCVCVRACVRACISLSLSLSLSLAENNDAKYHDSAAYEIGLLDRLPSQPHPLSGINDNTDIYEGKDGEEYESVPESKKAKNDTETTQMFCGRSRTGKNENDQV